ncbi:RNA polymerase sigma factor [Hymenobacter coccineus]|uniref:RNA polymerase subunit sigma-24 n=1 Tax=Hymenobacter coccineus TaxID=1908235 RepID=A0A1G1TG53_9BACT|nr:sigma-70 family RNA polymerase sigma factor [Hymenobacter coccineus]OGX89857.1 hypothetical protein BEN49_24280 [Hymenobacter coccineus]
MPVLPADLPDLLARCACHEPAAQQLLYHRYAGRMLGVARRYAHSVPEAEDILQDAFIKAFTRLGEFRAEGSFEGWLRRIVVTTALNQWQRGHRRPHVLLDNVPEPASADSDALDRLGVAEVLALMAQLPDGCRLVLNLYALDGYTHAEIAEALGIQVSTSKAQLSKARKQLVRLHQQQTNYLNL